jgi:site-specific recombinase XerD
MDVRSYPAETITVRIRLHTLRHVKGTIECHKTKDITCVQQALSHQDIKSTTTWSKSSKPYFKNSLDNEFYVKVARTEEKIKSLA